MAYKNNCPRRPMRDLKVDMSVEDFKKWLKKFDADRDGRITAEELWEAIRTNGGLFSGRKAKQVMMVGDKNGNGVIDEDEIINLVEFAQKKLGLRIIVF